MRSERQQRLSLEWGIGGVLLIKAKKQQRSRAVFNQRTPTAPDLDFNRQGLLFSVLINVFKNGGRVVAIRVFPRPAQRLEVDRNGKLKDIVALKVRRLDKVRSTLTMIVIQ